MPKPLSAAQERAAMYIAEGMTQIDTGFKIGRNNQTIWRWCQQKAFKARVKELQTDIIGDATDFLRRKLQTNLEIVQNIAEGGFQTDEESASRLRFTAARWAAEKILKPLDKEADPKGDKRVREMAVELDRLTGDDSTELLTRGISPDDY